MSLPMPCFRPWPRGTRDGTTGVAAVSGGGVAVPAGLLPQATYVFKHALIQDAAYQSLLKRTRQQYHQHIAQVLVVQFPQIVETQPELLAHHYTEAGLAAQVVGYWQRAGTQPCAFGLWKRWPTSPRGWRCCRRYRTSPCPARAGFAAHLGQALAVTKGAGAPEVGHAIARARELCHQVGDASAAPQGSGD